MGVVCSFMCLAVAKCSYSNEGLEVFYGVSVDPALYGRPPKPEGVKMREASTTCVIQTRFSLPTVVSGKRYEKVSHQ